MQFLVDTHIALWAILDSERLSAEAKRILESGNHTFFVSYVSVWEVAIKHRAHPSRMPIPPRAFAEKCREAGFRLLPISLEPIIRTEDLPYGSDTTSGHKDPFDRLLLCQADVENMEFLTHDSNLGGYRLPYVHMV